MAIFHVLLMTEITINNAMGLKRCYFMTINNKPNVNGSVSVSYSGVAVFFEALAADSFLTFSQ